MKVLTLNCYSWVENVGESQLENLAIKIAQEDYDLITLQEVNQTFEARQGMVDGFYCPSSVDQHIKADNFALRLVEKLQILDREYYWSWAFTHISYQHFEEGVALLSKEPLIVQDHSLAPLDESDPTKDNVRRIIMGVTEVKGKLVQLVSGHYNWWERGFDYEWQETEKILEEVDYPVIFGGDFNQPAGSPGYQVMKKSFLGLVDAYQEAEVTIGGAATVPGAINGWNDSDTPKRIDYFWLDPSFTVKKYAVTFDGENGPVVSDHFGISIELE